MTRGPEEQGPPSDVVLIDINQLRRTREGRKLPESAGGMPEQSQLEQTPPTEFDWDDAIDEDVGYSPYTVYSDLPGQESVTVRFPAFLVRDIAKIIEQRSVSQYETRSDLIKDAVLHRLKFCNDFLVTRKDPELDSRIAVLAMQSQQEGEKKRLEAHNEALRMLEENIESLRKMKAWGGLANLLEKARRNVEKMDEPWKGQALKILLSGERVLQDRDSYL